MGFSANLDDVSRSWHPLPPSSSTTQHSLCTPSVSPSTSFYEPYRDYVDEEEGEDNDDDDDDDTSAMVNRAPPPYEPMYDYLRQYSMSQFKVFPSSYPYSLDSSCPTYSDRPYIVQISEPQSFPTYVFDDLYLQQEVALRILDDDHEVSQESDTGESFETEDFVKWMVMMMVVCLTVASVGTAFDWGRP